MEGFENLAFRSAIKFVSEICRLSAIRIRNDVLVEHLGKSLCKFQLDYANYQSICAALHKELRLELSSDASSKGSLKKRYEEFANYSSSQLARVFGDTQKQIEEYFELSRTKVVKDGLRVGIHIHQKDKITRMIPERHSGQNVPYTEYSVFDYIKKTGLPYLKNNTPLEIINNEDYKFHGLNRERIEEEYKPLWYKDTKFPSRLRRGIFQYEHFDKDWTRAVLGNNTDRVKGFKSHIVVPITFKGHTDKSQMCPKLQEDLGNKDGRSILGYIFVDSSETFYFDDSDVSGTNIDANILYFYGDLLSLYMLTYLTYNDFSETVMECKDRMS